MNINFWYLIKQSSFKEYPKTILGFKDIIRNILKNETKNGYEDEIKNYDSIFEQLEEILNNYDTFNIDNGSDNEIITNKMIITLTSTKNQRNNQKNNKTTLDLGEC